MKIFLIWAAPYSQLSGLINKLKGAGHEIPYWVGLYEDGKAPDLDGTIFHDHYDAWVCEPAKGVDPSEFPPPGKELIEKMYRTESLVLTMMNKKFDTLCVDERKHIYYNMLRYWDGLLGKYKPEAIVFPAFPHTVYNFIIFNLARLRGIKTIMFDVPWVSDRLLMYNDVFEGSVLLQKEIEKNLQREFKIEDLSSDIQEYYKLQTDKKSDPTPVYSKRFKENFYGVKNIFLRKWKLVRESINDGSIFRKTLRYLGKFGKQNLQKEYEALHVAPDLNKNFVYAPLCYQPEASSSPLGDMFVDQILMLETLSASLPDGWVVYVKEHFAQWWLRSSVNYSSNRYPGYYKRIAALKNVQLIPVQTDSYVLIDKAKATAVLTGTAGWEALMRSRPVIMFGYPWYRDCPELFKVQDIKSCKEALVKIKNGFKVEQKKMINYLYSFDKASFHGYFEVIAGTTPKLSRVESMKNITEVILSQIK